MSALFISPLLPAALLALLVALSGRAALPIALAVGAVSAANSLIGKSIGDHISFDGIFPLDNGNFEDVSGLASGGSATRFAGAGTSARPASTRTPRTRHARTIPAR